MSHKYFVYKKGWIFLSLVYILTNAFLFSCFLCHDSCFSVRVHCCSSILSVIFKGRDGLVMWRISLGLNNMTIMQLDLVT